MSCEQVCNVSFEYFFLLVADILFGNSPLPIYDKGRRERRNISVASRDVFMPHIDMVARGKIHDHLSLPIKSDTNDHKSLTFILVKEPPKVWDLSATRRASGRPKIENDNLPTKVPESHKMTVEIRESEVRSHIRFE